MTTEAPSQLPQPCVTVPCSPARVLVVDDDAEFRILARKIMETAGFEVSEAAAVNEAITYLLSNKVELIVLDICLPGQDGIEALAALKTSFPQTRIVTVSGAENSELYLRVSAYLGADASLDKSKIASLCALLKVVLDR